MLIERSLKEFKNGFSKLKVAKTLEKDISEFRNEKGLSKGTLVTAELLITWIFDQK